MLSLLQRQDTTFIYSLFNWIVSYLRKFFFREDGSHGNIGVLYLSNNYMIVNKPYDLRINTDDPADKTSLHFRLYEKYPNLADKSLKHYFYFVHRLDYSTSGLICIALNKKACAEASLIFQKRKAKKYYIAILRGHVSQIQLNISQAIGELLDDCGCGKMGSDSGGAALSKVKTASTKLLVLERGLFATYPATKVVLMPETGRRHQLRVHCSFIGHTIVGDYTYSNRKDTEPLRMYLHSYRLDMPCKCEPLEVESLDPFQPSDKFTGWYPVEQLHPLNKQTLDKISQQTQSPR